MSKKTEVLTLAAVVASLGTALGVASTDLQAAEATQYKELPGATQDKQNPDTFVIKGKPQAAQGKLQPGAEQPHFGIGLGQV